MATPTVVGVGTASAGTSDVNPTRHASTATDDICFLIVSQSAVNDFNASFTPSGWSIVPNCQQEAGSNAATDACGTLYWRRVQGGDGDPTVPDTGNHTNARIITVRGCPTSGDPWSVAPSGQVDNNVNTSISISGQTPADADCLVLIFVITGRDQASTTEVSGWANSDLSNIVEQMDNWDSSGNGSGFACISATRSGSSAFGTTTATLVNSDNKVYFVVTLKGAGISGTANITQAADTLSADSDLIVKGTASPTQAGDTISSDSDLYIKADASITQAGDSLSSDSDLIIKADANITEAGNSLSSTSVIQIKADANPTQSNDTLLASGKIDIKADANINQAEDTLASAGVITIVAAANINQAGDSLSGTSTLLILANADINQENDTLNASGSGEENPPIEGELLVTQDNNTLSSTAVLPVIGTANVNQSSDSLSSDADLYIQSTLSVTQASDTVASISSLQIKGQANLNQDNNVTVSASEIDIRATANLFQANNTLLAVSTLLIAGNANLTQADNILIASGREPAQISGLGKLQTIKAEKLRVIKGDPIEGEIIRKIKAEKLKNIDYN